MTFKVSGQYNTATVHTNKDRDECDEDAIEQIAEMANSEAFVGDDDIAIMPDFHWGSGAVIGFTMPVKDRVVPNTVGVDIGCGMLGVHYGDIPLSNDMLDELDTEIRKRVPTGYDVHDESDYHLVDDFPWHYCERSIEQFNKNTDFDVDPEYSDSYVSDMCDRVGADLNRVINSMGTLGGGNHFIEIGRQKSNGFVWAVIHSGSRKIGAEIATYWQDRATNLTTRRQTLDDVPESVVEYMNENWKPRSEKIRNDFSGEAIQRKFDEVSQAIAEYGPSKNSRNTDLDYLQGEEAHGYIKDMAFAQVYASESRREMSIAVTDAINKTIGSATEHLPGRSIESVHNYIDYSDATIRKGACKASERSDVLIPLNMNHGTIIAQGKGKDAWNSSSAHGAGRRMSRRAAKRQYDSDDFDEQIDNVFMSEQPLDEIPASYKDPQEVTEAMADNVEIVDHIEPILSIKAP
ncbi:MAG: hypothetical protein J07AB43_00770 [Candidatus Nanosalina sp. J07AB43]|nr:MAG: hypothetical protein J07AB43_00770 [Candidatus Nanosalina sp. J07AB43]